MAVVYMHGYFLLLSSPYSSLLELLIPFTITQHDAFGPQTIPSSQPVMLTCTTNQLLAKMRLIFLAIKAEVEVLPDAALTVITWMDSETWAEFSGLLRLSGVADGDVARLVSQTADHLNQLTRLEKTHPLLAQSAKVGRSRLLRPPFSESLIPLD